MEKTTQDFLNKINLMTGKTYDEIIMIYKQSNLTKLSEIRSLFMQELQLSYGFTDTLIHIILKSDGTSMAEG